jgi:hypothetical protein
MDGSFATGMSADHEELHTQVAIGNDERRMHVRAYNYWSSLLRDREFPSIEDLDGRDVSDFADHSLLLDFTASTDNPVTSFIGAALRAECEVGDEVQTIADVPPRSLLSRLTDHWLQIVANRAPIGFEAEFTNQRGDDICYRGILMPFSSDGQTIDFIYGVINWKDGIAAPQPILPVVPDEDVLDLDQPLEPEAEEDEVRPVLDVDAGLADRLSAARETVEVLKAADGRSRVALYRALSFAYDFAVAARRVPDDYAELLDDAGIKAQARAPMTPIVKLVFGADYDKARLTEFAAALAHAERCEVEFEDFLSFIERFPGGLKGLVAAERDARRPDRRSDNRADKARVMLRAAAAQPLNALAGNDEFALVLVRRDATGKVEPVCAVPDLNLLEKAFRHLS